MIVDEIVYNLLALLFLSVSSNLIIQRYDRITKNGQILQGLLFGIIAITSMSFPYVYQEGIIFDGSIIIVNLSTLFFGIISGGVTTFLAILYRFYLGSAGFWMGITTILFSFLIGYYFYKKFVEKQLTITPIKILLSGLLISISSLTLLIVFLPKDIIIPILLKLFPTAIIFYTSVTFTIGFIILNNILKNEKLLLLKEKETSLHTTFYNIADAIITTDNSGNITSMNSAAEELTGWKETEVKTLNVEKLLEIRDLNLNNKLEISIKTVLNEGKTINIYSAVLINRNGNQYPVSISLSPIIIDEIAKGTILLIKNQSWEIKYLKQLEEKDRFQSTLLSNLPGFVYRCVSNKKSTILFISDGCIKITGYSASEFLNGTIKFFDIIKPEFINEINNLWEKAIYNKDFFDYDYQITCKGGELKWVWERGRGIFTDGGELLYIEGYVTDITDKKNFQLKLEKNEKKLRLITETVGDYLFSASIDEEGNSVTNWVAGAFTKITGYSFEEFLKIGDFQAIVHPSDLEKDKNTREKILFERQSTVQELRIIHKSGRIVWIKEYAQAIWDHNHNRLTEIIGAVQDITQNKKNEILANIQISLLNAILNNINEKEIYKLIAENLSQIIDIKNFYIAFYDKESGLLRSVYEFDEKDDISIWKAKGSLTGYLIEKNKLLCLKKNDIVNLLSQNKIILIGEISEQWLGVPLNVKNEVVGALVVQDYNNPDAFDDHTIKIIEFVASMLNLFLEKKRIETVILESEERFRNMFENQKAILLLMDAESGMIIEANEAAQSFYKYSLEELKKITIFDIDIFPPEAIKNAMIDIYKGKKNRFVSKHKLANGQIRYVELFASLITIKNHKFIYAIIFDITEQKKAEKELLLYKTVIIQNPTMITIMNKSGEIEFVNPKFIEFNQFKLEEIKGRKINILNPDFYSKEFYDEIWSKVKKGESWEGEILCKKKDGTHYWAKTIFSPIKDKYGELTHFVVVQEDITQQKNMLNDLIKSEERFRILWENSIDAMRLVDESGIVVDVNEAYCRMFNISRNQLVGKPFTNAFVHKNVTDAINKFIQRFKRRTIQNKTEADLTLHNGKLINVEILSTFIESKDSTPLLLSIFKDITSYKNLLIETIQAKEKAEEMNKVKSYFFANMSHELRTPLVGILGFADILKEELSDQPELSRMAELILKSGQRLHETLNLILNLSKLEAEKLEVKLVEENIIPHIKFSFQLFEQAAKSKGIDYILDIPEDEIICKIDTGIIQNILNNLISNAIKFTERGNITVKLEVINSNARIYVQDTGIGIPKEKQDLIWEEFRQVSEGLNRSFEGTGLGLAIVKKFTELIRGKIYLESEKDKGSRFILEIPLAEKKFENDKKDILSHPHRLSNVSSTDNKFDILYVEDDPSSANLVSLMLKNEFTFNIASNPDEAILKCKKNIYKAILMDINLKHNIDGVKLTSMIRQLNGYEKIPIAAITAYTNQKDKELFLANGLTHYLPKPFSKKDLLNLISKMIIE